MKKRVFGLLMTLMLLAGAVQAQLLTGSITATSGSVQVPIANSGAIAFVLTGTWTGTLTAQVSPDNGVTWVSVPFYAPGTNSLNVNTTVNVTGVVTRTSGMTYARIFATSLGSGTAVVTFNRGAGPTELALSLPPIVSNRPTYIASVSGQATTGAYLLSIESSSAVGFKITKICYSSSPATAAAAVTVTVQRRTTAASSGGTALTNEGTGATAISKMDPADANYPGIARLNGTPGTAGAVLDQQHLTVAEIAAGTADPGDTYERCIDYCRAGEKCPTAPIGVVNGISINVTAAGAGGLAAGGITATIISE